MAMGVRSFHTRCEITELRWHGRLRTWGCPTISDTSPIIATAGDVSTESPSRIRSPLRRWLPTWDGHRTNRRAVGHAPPHWLTVPISPPVQTRRRDGAHDGNHV